VRSLQLSGDQFTVSTGPVHAELTRGSGRAATRSRIRAK